MNLKGLTNKVSQKRSCTKKEAKECVDAVMKSIEEGLVENGRCQLTGFGSFTVKEMKSRKGRNPRNPEETYEISARNQVTFRAGKTLKETVND